MEMEEWNKILETLIEEGMDNISLSQEQAIEFLAGDYEATDELRELVREADKIELWFINWSISIIKGDVETEVFDNVFDEETAWEIILEKIGPRKIWDILANQYFTCITGPQLRAVIKRKAGIKLNSTDRTHLSNLCRKYRKGWWIVKEIDSMGINCKEKIRKNKEPPRQAPFHVDPYSL